MPTYTFQCVECGDIVDKVSSMTGLDNLKQSMYCHGKLMGKLITVNSGFFTRSAFPTEVWEHAATTPMAFKDKIHLKDHCDEVGLISRLLEDGDVP